MNELIESSLSRLWKHTQDSDVGAITAFRGDNTKSQNKALNKKLMVLILRSGYGVTKVKGSYIEQYGSDQAREVGEESFFVVDNTGKNDGSLERDLIKFGNMFDQDSILSIKVGATGVLIGTSKRDNAFPSYNERFSVGTMKGGTGGEFFSRVKGRKFTFESVDLVEEIKQPSTLFGRWGLAIKERDILNQLG